MDNTFDIQELFKKTFGSPASTDENVKFTQPTQITSSKASEDISFAYAASKQTKVDLKKKSTDPSSLGSPFFTTDAVNALGRPYFMPVKLNGAYLPYPIIRISGKKTIVETSLVGQAGTVKELISLQDYHISIKGLIIGTDGNWPEEAVKTLIETYKIGKAVSIDCPLTDLFLISPENHGSNQAVITSIDFPETKGVENVVGYSLELVSDHDFKLVLNRLG